MPRNPNEPPPLNPSADDVGRGGQREHIDNNNIHNPSNPAGFREIAANAGNNPPQPDASSAASGNPTVTVQGDITGTKQVTPGTQLMDVLASFDSNFKDFEYTRVDGSKVDLAYEVKGDVTVVSKAKASSENKGTGEQNASNKGQPNQGGSK